MTDESSAPRTPETPRVLVIHNPAAGRGQARLNAVLACLERLGCRPELRATSAPGDAEAFARAAAGQGFERVVAAGGDGTVNEVVNGLAGQVQGQAPALALLPLGTANVLAIEIGLDLTPEALAETILHGRPRPVSLGRVRGADGATRLFSLMAGIGADAHAVAGVNLTLKRVLGRGAYYVEMARQLLAFPFPGYRITVDGESHDAASVIVAKGRYYAGRYLIAPEAKLTEAAFQVCLFERGGSLAALRYANAMRRGRLAEQPGYRILTAHRVAIEGPAGDPVQADGDIVAALPVTIEVVPDALQLVMPL